MGQHGPPERPGILRRLREGLARWLQPSRRDEKSSSAPDDSDSGNRRVHSPDPSRIVRRALCMSALACRSILEQAPAVPHHRDLAPWLPQWLEQAGAADELEPWEAAVLAAPLGSLEMATLVEISWLCEGAGILAWVFDLFDLPKYDQPVDAQAVTAAFDFLLPSATELYTSATLRPQAEIDLAAEQSFALHWRIRHFTLTRAPIDFAKEAANAWFGPLDLGGLELADNDLAIGGVPIAEAETASVATALSIAAERHRAFNWLRGYHATYSKVSTDT